MRGNSSESTGTAYWARSLGAKRQAAWLKEERVGLDTIIHSSLIPSPNLQLAVASIKLKCREAYFPDDPVLNVDPKQLVREMLASLNFEPEAYQENLADARALAAKIGAEISPADIPAHQPRPRSKTWGPHNGGIGINGNLAGFYDIYSAAKLAEAMTSPLAKAQSPPV